MDLAKKAQLKVQNGAQSRAQVESLIFNKAPTEVMAEYSDYSNVFSTKNAAKLLENIGINEHTIKLEKSKQPSFGPIYSLSLIKLESLKIYIKTNLINSFIWPSKSSAKASILFDQKPDRSLRLCVNYWGLSNITIKNQYPLPLIGGSLDRLGWTRQFTQLDLTNAYH